MGSVKVGIMPGKSFTSEQIVGKIREPEVAIAKGKSLQMEHQCLCADAESFPTQSSTTLP